MKQTTYDLVLALMVCLTILGSIAIMSSCARDVRFADPVAANAG